VDVHGDELGQTLLGGLDLKEGEDSEPLIGFAFPFRCLLSEMVLLLLGSCEQGLVVIAIPTRLVLCLDAHLLLNHSTQLPVFLLDRRNALLYFPGELFHRRSIEEVFEFEGVLNILNSAVLFDLLLLVVFYQCHIVELINLRLLLVLSLYSLQFFVLSFASDCVLELAESLLSEDSLVLDDVVI
jgi:hypothetical protein